MKKSALRIVALILMLLMLFTACAPVSDVNGGETTDEKTTEAPTTENNDEEDEDCTTGENTTVESTTEEPTTEEATTEEPTTDEVTTEEPTTDEVTTEEVTTEPVPVEPAVKENKKILMIGNSFCYYFVEELYAMAAADGYDLTVANLYESGCSVSEHWMYGVSQNQDYYQFFVTTSEGRKQITEVTKFDQALAYDDWDVISLQQHFYPDLALNASKAVQMTKSYAKNLYKHIREKNPDAELYWQQTWAYQVGYAVSSKYGSLACPQDTAIADAATQALTHQNIKSTSQTIAQDNNVKLVPSGDAWQIARADSRVGDDMCARLGVNDNLGDYYHDGDIGGGQYLNACVWYEVIMGESCIGNTWRPSYELSEEKIVALQEAAHAAVAAVYGADHAK